MATRCRFRVTSAPDVPRKDPMRPARMSAVLASGSCGPVTAALSTFCVSWPSFSSSVRPARTESTKRSMRVSDGVRGGRKATLAGVLARSGAPLPVRVQAPANSANAAARARMLVEVTPGSCSATSGLTRWRFAQTYFARCARKRRVVVTMAQVLRSLTHSHFTGIAPPHVGPLLTRRPAHDVPPRLLERLHDVRLVRPLAKPQRPSVVRGRDRELGDRAVRISPTGPGEPDRLYAGEPGAAQGSAGGRHVRRIRAVRRVLHAPAAQMGLRVGGPLHCRRGVLHVQIRGRRALTAQRPKGARTERRRS